MRNGKQGNGEIEMATPGTTTYVVTYKTVYMLCAK